MLLIVEAVLLREKAKFQITPCKGGAELPFWGEDKKWGSDQLERVREQILKERVGEKKTMTKPPNCRGEGRRGWWGRGVGWDGKMSGEVFGGKGCPGCSGRSWCLVFNCLNCLTRYTGTCLLCVRLVLSKAQGWINLSLSCTHSPLQGKCPHTPPSSRAMPSAGLCVSGSGECVGVVGRVSEAWGALPGAQSCLWYRRGAVGLERGPRNGNWRALLGETRCDNSEIWTRSVTLQSIQKLALRDNWLCHFCFWNRIHASFLISYCLLCH